jgi:hypothetical protein
MGLRGSGLNRKSSHNSIIGYSDSETVMLDFDHTPFRTVRYWSRCVMKRFRLGGCLILKSSDENYHVVFNRPVSWSENMKIVAWTALVTRNDSMKNWLVMQCIKGFSTLRVSAKAGKPAPRIVSRCGREDQQIQSFRRYRRRIKTMIQQLHIKKSR